jgi:4-hydroxy 2-oxovalerate aldolase
MGTPNVTHLLVPVANPDDAERRCDALEQYLGPEVERITIVHVIERPEGYLDSASPEALEQEADQLFSYVENHLEDGPEPDCELRYGTDTVEEIVAAADELEQAKLAILLLPGVGVADDLTEVRELSVDVARICTHCTEADIAEQHIALARELGMTTVGFLMMAHMVTPEQLLAQARIMEAAGAETVYVTDSAGALTTDGFRARVAALVEGLDCAVGVHAHNNLQLAVANSLAAYEEGARWIDACTRGLGAGAGNTPTEILVAACDRLGIDPGVETFAVADVAEEVVAPIMGRPQIVDRSNLLLGYAGVYSSFHLHAERASERFGVPVADILVELGRRGVVGGQEDMIVDVAAELAAAREPDHATA